MTSRYLVLATLPFFISLSNAFHSMLKSSSLRNGNRIYLPRMSMDIDAILPVIQNPTILQEALPHWAQIASQGVAEAVICPGFGEPGWAPFCFLNGNPVFVAFDSFQGFVQSSVVSLHDILEKAGVKNAYGPSIILFTVIIRLLLFPVTYKQLESTQRTQALSPKVKEIQAKYAGNKELQNQMVALLYEETKVNPLAGCLPALLQTPVFIALYRSFTALASSSQLGEPFLWVPSLEGPVFGERSLDWLAKNWVDGVPPLGWHDTVAYLSLPVLLVIAQTVSLKVLSPPSDDPAVQSTQRILKYLPLLLGYFALSVPAGLGVYWVTNNLLSTLTSGGIKQYFKMYPVKGFDIDIEKLGNSASSVYTNPIWGYTTKDEMIEEAKLNRRLHRRPKIPADFPTKSQIHLGRNRTLSQLYSDAENVLLETPMTWADFIAEVKTARHRSETVRLLNASTLVICPTELSANISKPLSHEDKRWCASHAQNGGKSLSLDDLRKFDYLDCAIALKGVDVSCDSISWGDNFVKQWRRQRVGGLCDDGANSRIRCFDSPSPGSRLCIFNHAMMNFKKMRTRRITGQDGSITYSRSWERGFLAADCGFKAVDNIGYLQIYKPDIAGSSDAICDYVFNDTVLAYSHENARNMRFGQVFSDYLNVFSMLWLSGANKFSKDITFLNIDGIRNGVSQNDRPSQYFLHYALNFRRIIRAADFRQGSTVCFKNLIMQPRPHIPFVRDGWQRDIRCSFVGPSSLFQRWNVQVRQNLGLLGSEGVRILLLIVRSLKPGRSSNNPGLVTRVFLNQRELIAKLQLFADRTKMKLIVQDLAKISFEEQVRLIASSSVLIGMHGAGVASAMHMAVGTSFCCGVLEIFPQGEFRPIRGYGNMARRMGHHYARIEIGGEFAFNERSGNNVTTSPSAVQGTKVPVRTLIQTVATLVQSIRDKPSCLLPQAIKMSLF